MSSPQALLRELAFHPSKAMGQNFLIHGASADKIVTWAGVKEGDQVVEIGPGLGALTDALARAGAHVTAIEKDRRLVQVLTNRHLNEPWLKLISGDALDMNWKDLTSMLPSKPALVANLPYSISTPLLEKLLEARDCFSKMCLLFQAEVVERLCSAPGSRAYGRLSIFAQVFCEMEMGPRISPGNFFPEPDVDSKLVRLKPRAEPLVPESDQPKFFQLVAVVFQHRRKTLRNAVRAHEPWKEITDAALAKIQMDSQRRPETLSIAEFLMLSRCLTEVEPAQTALPASGESPSPRKPDR